MSQNIAQQVENNTMHLTQAEISGNSSSIRVKKAERLHSLKAFFDSYQFLLEQR